MNLPVLLVYHAARGDRGHVPNSIRGLQACLDEGARVIEVDISPLADGEFLLFHDSLMENGTTGSGLVSAHTADQIRGLRLTQKGVVTDEPVGLLSQALELVARHPHAVELQLDLKPYSFLPETVLSRLVAALQPVKDRVRVTSVADWALRRLHAMDAAIPLGFDPLFYLDVSLPDDASGEQSVPPYQVGAYGYRDDHPLAARRWGQTADYLAARAEALWAQAPLGDVWYIRGKLLARALEDGFDWIANLNARGVQVDAWTLDPARPSDVPLARHLLAAGVDRITTNAPQALAQSLAEHPTRTERPTLKNS